MTFLNHSSVLIGDGYITNLTASPRNSKVYLFISFLLMLPPVGLSLTNRACPSISGYLNFFIAKKMEWAIIFSAMMVLLLTLTSPIYYFLHHFFLKESASFLNLLGVSQDLLFFQLFVYFSVVTLIINLLVFFMRSLSFFNDLPLYFTTYLFFNSAFLGASLLIAQSSNALIDSIISGFGAGLGQGLVLILLAGIGEKMKYADVPMTLRGPAIVFMIMGLMSFTFMSFSGWVL